MAVRNDFTAGEVLAAADLNDTFASKLPYSYGTATPSTTDSGFLWYDSNSTPAAPKFWDGTAFQEFGGGTIAQIVRATDSTNRTTTSTALTDASLSVTITPTKSDSAVLLIYSGNTRHDPTSNFIIVQITDSSNNAISGAEGPYIGSNTTGNFNSQTTLIGYATPATTSAVTYKIRFRAESSGTATLANSLATGQLIAIEVTA